MIIYIRIKLAKYDVSYIIMGNHDTRRLAFVSIISSDDCERSRAKRGELAELASLRKARELMYRYMGKQNN